ncbi:RHS repeat-associated core domain-containing protein [Kitasatospora paracochleata]|uniref:RHS repeat-associated protein n=1 Tax=Kitasatospora paracochleata TaxID=58354 RepID=A0ABT1J767_9ACTN|nr:RHS repeat-associated core domain-containing protein [Kitasatospora paracochleata]MCP2313277.1 RHS repeat-associated protein [Kitasatospora paracochleata]
MSNQIVKALEHGAEKLGKTLAEDAGKALKGFYKKAGDNLKKVAHNTREVEAKHAKDLEKILSGHGGKGVPHPRAGSGGHGPRGTSHPKRRGRDQVQKPRTEGRRHDSRKCPGEPVDIATGRMFIDQVDASLPGSLPLEFTRNFESGLLTGRWMGPKWICTFDERLEIDEQGVVHIRADRITQAYPHPEPGDPVFASAGSRHELDLTDGLYTVTDPATGLLKEFTPTPERDEALLTRVRDRHGRHYTFSYDEDGIPLAITHSGGYKLLVTVDADRITALRLANATESGGDALLMRYSYTDGDLTAVYNSSGKPMRFANDAVGRVLSWTDRNNSQYRYTYDQHDRITDEGGADGTLRFHFAYGDPDPETGLRTHTETNVLGHTTTYLINENAQITAVTDPLGHTTTYERDDYDRLLAETDPLGRTTRYEYDGAGDLVRVTRPDGEQTTVTYSDRLSLPVTIAEPGGATWQQEYDDSGLRTALTDPLGATTRYTHDELGHLTSITDALGNTSLVTGNAAGLPVELTGPTGALTRLTRDAFGRIRTITDPLGGITRLTWTVEGNLATRTAADGSTQSWTYDGEGNNLTHTDELGQVTTLEYTHFETLAARTTPDGSRMTFTHDANMQLVAVTNAIGQAWKYTYDDAGRLVGETDFDGRTLGYTLDGAGQLTAVTDPLGRQTVFGYDLMGRTVSRTVGDRRTVYGYDPSGHLTRASGPDAEILRTVDALGRLLTESVNGRTLSVTRDRLGRRLGRTTPSGHTSVWEYDAAGRPAALTTGGGRFGFAYDAIGRERERTIGDHLTLTSDWDDRHALVGQSLRTTASADRPVLQQQEYEYRADGHLVGLRDSLRGGRTFDVSPTGRVVAVRAETWTEQYTYDPNGNQLTADWPRQVGGETALGAREYTGTRLTAAGRVRYEYDSAGRMTLRRQTRLSKAPATWHYTWDDENRLAEVRTPDGSRWRYTYDPFGRRIAKCRLDEAGAAVEQTHFTWDGTVLVEQWTEAPALPGRHVITWDHQGVRPLAQNEAITARTTGNTQDETDRRFFAIVTDLVGTPSEILDPATGQIAWQASSTLWGRTAWPADSATYTPLRFPGQYYDPETRLHYNLHRYYDPETARYISPDPLGLIPSPNPLAYVDNPHAWIDPLGLSPHWYGDADFVVGSNGVALPTSAARLEAGLNGAVTSGAPGFGTFPTKSAGTGYELPGGNRIRIMQPQANGAAGLRASFTNATDAPVSPFTGKPVQPPKKLPPGMTPKQHVRERTHLELEP